MARSKGNLAQFTYDFGIAIAQSTVNKVTKLAGVTLTLASAFYALKSAATSYVSTLRENTLRFGGVLSTMKAMEQAQNRLIKGQSYFSVEDQLAGMNKLMEAGVNVGDNLEWINKAAHATGKSYAEFSGMIASAIQGNTSALVDAGLMTQRATRMFDRYQANTIMRQQAILNFVKSHKGLMNAIKNDFETVKDQMLRIKSVWRGFVNAIVGKPNDPSSLYGQTVSALKMVAEGLSRHFEYIKRAGYMIGRVLGWVIKQVGHFVTWLGRKLSHSIENIWKLTDAYQEQTRSLIVWLEFWKLKILDFIKDLWKKTSEFFHKYQSEIKTICKLALAYIALKNAFVISKAAIASVVALRNAWLLNVATAKRYGILVGPGMGKGVQKFHQLMAFLPRSIRRPLIKISKLIGRYIVQPISDAGGVIKWIGGLFGKLGHLIMAPFKFIGKGLKSVPKIFKLLRKLPMLFTAVARGGKAVAAVLLGSNPIGWIITAIMLLVTLYNKCKAYRVALHTLFKFIWESLKFIYNLIVGAFVYIMVGLKKAWLWFKEYIWNPVADFFKKAWKWITGMWKAFMNSKVGKFINDWIITPLKSLFEWLVKAWKWVISGVAKAVEFLSGANSELAKNINNLAKAEGLSGLAIAAKGGNYDTNDDTNYLDPKNWAPSEPKVPQSGNPLVADNSPTATPSAGMIGGSGGGGGTTSTNMTFGDGAIQIIVQKGEGIDETILAQKVKGILNDMRREGDMRGGTI